MAKRRNDFDDPIAINQGGTGANTASGARTSLGITIGASTIVGTNNEIVVTDGDGFLGDPTISLAVDAELPGGGAVTTPVGSTAARPGVPVEGMIRGNSDTGFAEIFSDGAWRIQGREIVGTANQIDVTNGDGIAGDPTLLFPDDVIFPGTGAVLPPTGTSGQRPGSPVLGMIRANTDTNNLEAFTAGSWMDLGAGGSPMPFFNNYLTGLSNTVASVSTMSFGVGQCTESANTQLLANSISFTKDITANWAEGDTLGGFPSALTLTANTVYYTFLIGKVGGTVDFGWDTDLSATNLLTDAAGSGYTLFRRIGSSRTQVGLTDLETIRQDGDYFYYELQRKDFTVAYTGAGVLDNVVAISVPDTIDVVAQVLSNSNRVSAGGGETTKVYVMPTTTTGIADAFLSHSQDAGGNASNGTGVYNIPTEVGTLRHYADVFGGAVDGGAQLSTLGWHDRRDQ